MIWLILTAMNETDIRNVVGPLLAPGEEIIWASATDPKAKIVVLDELRQHAQDRATDYLYGAIFVVLLMVFVPLMRTNPQEWIGVVIFIIGLDVITHLTKVWMTKRDKIGGYALTRTHFYELDRSGNVLRKLGASNVRYAFENDNGIALAPLGKTINSSRVIRWLPQDITADQVQAAIGG